MSLRVQLINRYGLLFRTRRLVCGKCLNIRYGEVRKERRALATGHEPVEHGQLPTTPSHEHRANTHPLISPEEFELAANLIGKDHNEVIAQIRNLIA